MCFSDFNSANMKLYGVLLLTLIIGSSCNSQKKQNKIAEDSRPNVIFLLTDDQRFDALGAMGNPIIKTPNLDKLAQKGILFKNAYVTTSICCVSRASILSGQYESRHQINDFKTDFTEEALNKTYPILLKDAGYKIGFIGKYGVGDDHPAKLYDYWSCPEAQQPDYINRRGNGEIIHHTDSVGNDIDIFLNQYSNKEPFCLSVSFKAPHEQDGENGAAPEFIAQERYMDMYKDVTIPTPLTADPKYWKSFPDFFRTDKNIARARWKLTMSTPELYQQTAKNYYRLISGVDEVVGNMIKKLEEKGIADNTIIIFMGDNGFYLGEHGLEGKWYGNEESIRVPLIVYDPRQTSLKGIKADQIALNIDIAPTILAAAHATVPAGMQGTNLLDMVKNKSNKREDFFYEHTYLESPRLPEIEGVVTGRFKYMNFIEHNYEQLYDIKNDPHETNNLVEDPKYKAELLKLRKRYADLKVSVK